LNAIKSLLIQYRKYQKITQKELVENLWVSKMLGYTTSAMTLNKYARYVENKDKKRGTFLMAS